MHSIGELKLQGAGGEPVDFLRTVHAHGVTTLNPMRPSLDPPGLDAILRAGKGKARRVQLTPKGNVVQVKAHGPAPSVAQAQALLAGAARLLRLDADLSAFYAMAADDPELAWVGQGAGRLARSASAYEDLIKTLLTTNCAWSATVRMVDALVNNLGETAHGGGRAFPTAHAMASVGEEFYRDVVRAGYRAKSLHTIARLVADGELDVELWEAEHGMADDEVEAGLLALPGIGPYAAAHMMMMLGRHSRLILDSWTRPTYAKLCGRKQVSDAAISKRFRRYGQWQGLAFWLMLTRDWLADTSST